MAAGDLTASLTFRRGAARVGLERIALLEAISELGSISGAARRLELSYKGAWDAVQALNNLFEAPLVEAAPGGRSGGAAALTPRGQAVLQALRRVSSEIEATLAKLESHVGASQGDDLFWSLGMKTSARNALRGEITAITPGAVTSEVTLKIADGVSIVATLTRRSIEDLQLAAGKPAIALIKASFIVLARGENLRTSARNQIDGVVTSRDDGTLSSEIALDIGGGKTLVATLTRESADALGLAPGMTATALVKAPHVILAVE